MCEKSRRTRTIKRQRPMSRFAKKKQTNKSKRHQLDQVQRINNLGLTKKLLDIQFKGKIYKSDQHNQPKT